MGEIRITAHMRIHEGKLNEFKVLAAEYLLSTREKDTGTLQYDWSFNEDQTECIVHEGYKNSAAMLQHLANLGDTLGALWGVCDLSSVEFHGTPSPELLKAAEGIDITFYSYFQSL